MIYQNFIVVIVVRCQRNRLGISYPNLNSICDDDFTSDDQTSEENKDSFHSRCSSNPDLLNGNGIFTSPSPSSSSSSSASSYTIAIVDINNSTTSSSSTTTLSSDNSDSLNDCVSYFTILIHLKLKRFSILTIIIIILKKN